MLPPFVTPFAGKSEAEQANAQAARPSPVERMAREEQRLRQRLADLTAERPAWKRSPPA